MKRFYIFALVATMFAACATDVTEDVAIEAPETLKVSFEESTRIQLDNGKTVWTKGDLVSVFYLSNANEKWQFQGETGARVGNLKRVTTTEATQELSNVVVVYPYNKNHYINPKSCNVRTTLPAVQHYLKDSYGLDGNIMISSAEYNQVSLKNVCGWLKIQLKGEGQVVKKITLKGNNGEQVAGQIYINSANATATLASEMGVADEEENGVGANLLFDDTILTEVTLDCGEGVTLSGTTSTFHIALPPQSFEKGLTLTVEYSDGSKMTKSTSNSIEIARNTILPMSTLYYDGNLPPVYELAYTTNDGEPLNPYTTEGFGANLVENVYDATTGQGALKFDGRITTIPAKAFIACGNLTQIELTKDVTTINAEAFSNCTALAVINISQSVKTIRDKAFYNCGGITEITIPSSVTSIGTSSFEGCGGKANINCKINSSDFTKAKFTEVIIGNSVTSIGASAFNGCTSLTSVTIPDSVTEIGNYAFADCTSLTSATIPDSVTQIGKYAFRDCTSLTSVTIPDSATSIVDYAFGGCTSLKEVYYTGDLSAWCKINFCGYNANPMNNGAKLYLNGVELTGDVTITSDVTEIKDYTFHGCTSLTSVTIGDRVTTIGKYAFRDCTSLTSVTIGDRVTSIGKNAFSYCTSLTSVTIPDSVTSIGEWAFYKCSSLTSVTIPDRVTEIGSQAFLDCTSLKEVYYKSELSAWCKIKIGGYYANPMNNGAKLYLNGVELTEASIPSDITIIKSYTFQGCTSLTSVTIPDSVTEIGGAAFLNCTSLTNVTIGDSVTSIGQDAFLNCTSLTSVTIPDSVTEIGYHAFYNCTSLTSVTIGDRVTEIGNEAFYKCTSLKEVYCKPTTPPSGGSDMFYYNASGRKIYVRRASVDAYKAASYWSSYKSYIEGYDF